MGLVALRAPFDDDDATSGREGEALMTQATHLATCGGESDSTILTFKTASCLSLMYREMMDV